MKTKEELNAPKEEVETQDEKIKELTDEELAQVTGGNDNACLCSCHHLGSFVNWHTGETFCNGAGASDTSCRACTHWIRPEGPCDLD